MSTKKLSRYTCSLLCGSFNFAHVCFSWKVEEGQRRSECCFIVHSSYVHSVHNNFAIVVSFTIQDKLH